MARHTFYIDLAWDRDLPDTFTWVEFTPESFSPFKINRESDQYFRRWGWGKLEIANDTVAYAASAVDVNKLYDVIDDFEFTQGVAVKYVSPSGETIKGYFGKNDCELDSDRKTLIVAPAILDIYTIFLENIEEEIDFTEFPITQTDLAVNLPYDNMRLKLDWAMNGDISKLIIKESLFNPTDNLNTAISNYFNVSTDESPNRDLINLASDPLSDADGFTLSDRETILEEIDYELSSLRIIVGEFNSGWIFGSDKRTLYCETVFSREVASTADVDGSPVSPEGDGWTVRGETHVLGAAGHVWTRKPFNGVYFENWALEDVITNPNSDGSAPTYTWFKKRTTKLAYPINDASMTINNSMGLKTALAYLYNRNLIPITVDEELEGIYAVDSGAVSISPHSVPVTVSSSDYEVTETLAVAIDSTTAFFASPSKVRTVEVALNIAGAISAPDSTPITLGIQLYLKVKNSDGDTIESVQVLGTLENNTIFHRFLKTQTETFDLLAGYSIFLEATITGAGAFTSYSTVEISVTSTETTYQDNSVISTFLFNDLDDVSPMVEGQNYVSLEPTNYLNNLRMFFTKDIKTSLMFDEIGNIPKISFKDFFDDLNKLFKGQLFWDIIVGGDNDGALRIEHIKFVDMVKVPLDIRDSGISGLAGFTNTVKYDKSKMFNLIEISQVNASYVDFIDNKITFDNIVSNNRNKDIKVEFRTTKISCDLRYMIENAADIDDGIVLVITDDAGENVVNNIGLISESEVVNGRMASSNLLNDFGLYEGVWKDGKLNGVPVNFKYTQRNKVGKELTLKGLQDSLFYQSNIGIGIIESGSSVDFENETTKITLRYRYNSTPETDTFVITFATDVWADFANYET